MKKILSPFIIIICVFLLCVFAIPASQASDESGFTVDQDAIFSALYEADIATLREAISLGLVSCEDVTAYYLERIQSFNGSYNCFITLCGDALDVARERDRQLAAGEATGILFGIPVVIKDNMDLAGFYTTNGRSFDQAYMAQSNAAVVDYLLSQGAVILAKANMSTDAQDARRCYSNAVGETKNAYNSAMSSGGSSGGSAVAVSLNFAAAGLGTDTNSSLRLPAVLNGCVSLRATFGLIPGDGCISLNDYRDTPGAITRTVYDQALMLDVLTNGAYSYAEHLNANALDGQRIGILTELSYATDLRADRSQFNIDPEVAAAFESAVTELESCGAEVVKCSLPGIFDLAEYTLEYDSSVRKTVLYKELQTMMEEYDISAIIFPTYLSTPLRSGLDENGVYWGAWNQVFLNNCTYLSPSASVPEISIPIGIHSLGAGIGMEIVTLRNNEQLLLDLAYSYTSRYDHRTAPDGAPNTYEQAGTDPLRAIIDDYYAYCQRQSTQESVPPESSTPAVSPAETASPAPTPSGTSEPTVPDPQSSSSPTTPSFDPPRFPFWVWFLPLVALLLLL